MDGLLAGSPEPPLHDLKKIMKDAPGPCPYLAVGMQQSHQDSRTDIESKQHEDRARDPENRDGVGVNE